MITNVNNERLVKKEFWRKVRQTAGKVPFMHDVVAMYFCAVDPKTPITAKMTIFGAIAYFISPLDLIPDLTPIIGYGDDAGIIATALTTVSAYINDEHREKAADWLEGNL
jgi:uncharacterized membrane protein YkvA (DUF1232 family)